MITSSFFGQNPFEAWNRLFEPAMKPFLAMGTATRKGQDDEKNPWMILLRQLWEAHPFSRVFPLDPVAVTRAFQLIWLDTLRNPVRTWSNYNDFVQRYTQIMIVTSLKFWGKGWELPVVIEPEKGDKRFSDPDWQLNPVFDFLKQSYLLIATTMLNAASQIEGLDANQRRKLIFYLRQFLDAISPTNTLFTNPQVVHETIQSGGQNLVRGMEHLMRDIQAGQVKMTDTEAFAPGRNLAITSGQVIYRNKLIELIQYAPSTEKVYAIPLLFIPPWINKYYILDMQPQNSLVKFLVERGYTVFVVSWKNPDASMEETSFEDYLTLGLLAALDVAKEITGSPKVNVVGYCIGGTLLALALSYLAARGDDVVNAATFLVSLLDFREAGDTCVFMDEPQVECVERQMMQCGYLDCRSMAAMFNLLRANDLIWSNVVNNYLMGKEPGAFDLLYWNNDGTRMARAAHSFYLRNTYLENNLIKPNKIVLKGVPIDLSRIRQEIYAVGTQQDHIVPWQSAWRISQLVSGPVRFVLAGSGHIAGVISPPGKERGYWTNEKIAENAEQWLEGAKQHRGSWWMDWVEWLSSRSGEQVPAPSMGSSTHPPIIPAPGSYVLER
ncbi:MAG TPA: class I poly(R)-hydroxyalkanoic acid synthase [Ktedonobacteraceae bacterium]|nr:class I poly(R)-hydroxyalkanoic acid synthase [Ktedonobacteraceae bacterium]